MINTYVFPDHYPTNCPPDSCHDNCGKYYRVAANTDKTDQEHYESYYQRKKGFDCKARALSMRLTKEQAIALIDAIGTNLGRFVICFDLCGGHGLVRIDNEETGHCSWWVPINVTPSNFWESSDGPF